MATGLTTDSSDQFLTYFRDNQADEQLLGQLREFRLEHAILMIGVAVAVLSKSFGNVIGTDQAIEVMVALEESHPDLMDEFFYGQPTSVNWANHVIRILKDQVAAASNEFAFQAAYLNSMMAAMCIRAQTAFKLKVPVLGGKLMLPTLGVISVDAYAGSFVSLSSDGQNLRIEYDGHTDVLSADLSETRPWEPLKLLVDPATGLMVVLDDLDPFRNQHPPAQWAEEVDLGRWQRLFAEAAQLLANHDPQGLKRINQLLVSITPIQPINPGDERSSSNPHSPGGMALTEPADALSFALLLLHETEHNLQSELLRVWSLGENTWQHFAPWRDDPRPTLGVVHGVRAFTVQLFLWHALHQRPGRYEGAATANLARWYEPTLQTIGELLTHGRLPEVWTKFIQATQSALEELEFTVAPAVQSAADDLNLWNLTQWQLRNRRFTPQSVDAACAAYLAGQHPPDMNYVLHAQPVLTEERVQGRHLLQLLELAAGVENSDTDLSRSPADHFYAQGQIKYALARYRQGIYAEPADRIAWAGLVLCLQHCSGTDTDRERTVLTRRLPEVYATWNELKARGESPALSRFIAWWGS